VPKNFKLLAVPMFGASREQCFARGVRATRPQRCMCTRQRYEHACACRCRASAADAAALRGAAELFQNERYGNIIGSVPQCLSRFHINLQSDDSGSDAKK
jgi:hypothetical protein